MFIDFIKNKDVQVGLGLSLAAFLFSILEWRTNVKFLDMAGNITLESLRWLLMIYGTYYMIKPLVKE